MIVARLLFFFANREKFKRSVFYEKLQTFASLWKSFQRLQGFMKWKIFYEMKQDIFNKNKSCKW